VVLLHPGDDDRSLRRHVPLVDSNLAVGDAYADAEARALGSSISESGDVGLLVVGLVGGLQAAGDAFFLGPDGDQLVKALIYLGSQAYVDRWTIGVAILVSHVASSCCWQ
jgi:hypothetical protein